MAVSTTVVPDEGRVIAAWTPVLAAAAGAVKVCCLNFVALLTIHYREPRAGAYTFFGDRLEGMAR